MMSRFVARCANSALLRGTPASLGAADRGSRASAGLGRLFSVLGPNQNRQYNLEHKLLPFNLNSLWNIRGARTKKKILGRGPGSKHG